MTSSSSGATNSQNMGSGGRGEESEEDFEGPTALVENRRLVATTIGLAVYVLFVFAEGGSGRSYTFHTVRYLLLVSGVYTLISGINAVWMYVFGERVPYANLTGGLSTTVGIGVFYLEVLVSNPLAPNPGILLFSAIAISVGMLLILKIDL